MPGGLTQPNPPPSMIAAEVDSHSACRSSSVNSVTRSTMSCDGWDGTSSAIASGLPAQEVAKDANANLLAFFHMKLRAGPVAGRDHGHYRIAIICHGNCFMRVAPNQGIAVDKIHVVTRAKTLQQFVIPRNEIQCVPAHLRQPQTGCFHLGDLAA